MTQIYRGRLVKDFILTAFDIYPLRFILALVPIYSSNWHFYVIYLDTSKSQTSKLLTGPLTFLTVSRTLKPMLKWILSKTIASLKFRQFARRIHKRNVSIKKHCSEKTLKNWWKKYLLWNVFSFHNMDSFWLRILIIDIIIS